MMLLLIAYLGGILTIVSPCILPVLPFVFSRAGQPFARSILPMLAGMAVMFAVVATLAAVGGGWVVKANQYGRGLAIVIIALFGLALLLPRLAERLTRPLVSAGGRLAQLAQSGDEPRPGASFLLGIATGLLWAPCAGPILGLILTGAALQGASLSTTLLLLAYAAGAATSLAAALLLGGKVFGAMKRSLGAGEWVRRGLGAAILCGVAAIGLGLDTGILAQLSLASTGGIEQTLINRLSKQAPTATVASANIQASGTNSSLNLPDEGLAPPLDGAVQWLNSPPLTMQALKGKVVLIDFWTYSCINCLRTLPYTRAWAAKYHDQGLVVIGVHAPEFAFERDVGNVKRAMRKLGVTYPVAIDNNYAIWRAYHNQYWPAHYFIDARGHIRHHHFGEGDYDTSERVIQQLLREAGATVPDDLSQVAGKGIEQAPDMDGIRSPETYLGYERGRNFASDHVTQDRAANYTAPQQPKLNQWGLEGRWTIGRQSSTLSSPGGRIVYRFHARDLHLVLGPGPDGRSVRFRVTIDGKAPGDAHGVDVAADGSGTVTEQRLYQLVRQPGKITDHTFSIEFLDPGVSAYAFTFG
ncbi:MAG: cytochrome c biogenesis protein DipZ [Alcaligenaceae bacterium]|nr:cytochrome c biogenesis protein DipZ [Alcaligenaceae bacterium]